MLRISPLPVSEALPCTDPSSTAAAPSSLIPADYSFSSMILDEGEAAAFSFFQVSPTAGDKDDADKTNL